MSKVAIVGSAVVPNAKYVQPEDDLIMRCIVSAAHDGAVKKEEIGALISMTPRSHTYQQYQTQHISSRLGLKVDLIAEFEISALGMTNAIFHAEKLIQERGVAAVAIVACSRESMMPTTEFFGQRTARTSDASFIGPYGMTPMSWNALGARQMIADGEATEEDFADVVVRLRRQAVDNPLAYFRKSVTREEVLASRVVSSPTRLFMVCPRTDGAGCIIVAREDIARRQPEKAVVRLATGMVHDGDNIIPERAGRSMWEVPAAKGAIEDLFERTGLSHDAIDVFEPWIPFAPLEVMVMRSMGFPRNYGETHCVSPSGGPIARGYPLLATGFYNLHEAVQQLRGHAGPRQKHNARHAMTLGETGNVNECVLDLFARYDGGAAGI